jgi:hypothetical protein
VEAGGELMVTRKKKKQANEITYHFNVGVTVDPKGDHPGARFEEGEEVGAEELPPHINLQALIRNGDVRPVEDN